MQESGWIVAAVAAALFLLAIVFAIAANARRTSSPYTKPAGSRSDLEALQQRQDSPPVKVTPRIVARKFDPAQDGQGANKRKFPRSGRL